MRSSIEFKLLSDVDAGCIRKDTFDALIRSPNTEIRTLLSLHAKIYIIDDWCLIISANLTGPAFCRRYEVGNVLNDVSETVQLFDDVHFLWLSSHILDGIDSFHQGNKFIKTVTAYSVFKIRLLAI